MKININNRLIHDDETPYPFKRSPNIGGRFEPRYLLMHYTVSSSGESAVNHLTNPSKEVSAHLVISRNGEITQLVSFDVQAHHAGHSHWEGMQDINRFAIGIELDNDGPVDPGPIEGQWTSPKTERSYPEDQIVVASHWKEFKEKGWLKFPKAQLNAALEVALVLKEQYQLVDVLGHEDVNRGKIDPGPAFPMEWFREQMFGRSETVIELFESTKETTIYAENEGGTKPDVINPSTVITLSQGKKVKVKKSKKGMKLIVAKVDKIKVRGWVPGDAVKKKKTTRSVSVFPEKGNLPVQDAPKHNKSPFPAGKPLRILRKEGNLTLVGSVTIVKGARYIQGWINSGALEPLGKALYNPIKHSVTPLIED
jgi:N-acetylmuramoyl-L-alanine amidase